MGISNFGVDNSSGIFYKLKPVPILNIKYSTGNDERIIPVMRTGASKYFIINSAQEIQLKSATTGAVVTTIAGTDIVANGYIQFVYLDSVAQCLYVVAYNHSTFVGQLAMINDNTGAVTLIGSTFSPATTTNWVFTSGTGFTNTQFMDSPSSGILRLFYDGWTHTLDATTGAIITEDVPITIGTFNTTGTTYINSEGTIASNFSMGGSVTAVNWTVPMVVSEVCGRVAAKNVAPFSFSDFRLNTPSLIAIDSDLLCVTSYNYTNSNADLKLFNRSDWDLFLDSMVLLAAGIS